MSAVYTPSKDVVVINNKLFTNNNAYTAENGIIYTPGYLQLKVHSDAPDACTGAVVQEFVEKFGFNICYLDQKSSSKGAGFSFYRLLDVQHCGTFVQISYIGPNCQGNGTAVVKQLQTTVCRKGTSVQCYYNKPLTYITKYANVLSTTVYPVLSDNANMQAPNCANILGGYTRSINDQCVYSAYKSAWIKSYVTYPSGYYIGFYSSRLNCLSSSNAVYYRKGSLNTCLTYSVNYIDNVQVFKLLCLFMHVFIDLFVYLQPKDVKSEQKLNCLT